MFVRAGNIVWLIDKRWVAEKMGVREIVGGDSNSVGDRIGVEKINSVSRKQSMASYDTSVGETFCASEK